MRFINYDTDFFGYDRARAVGGTDTTTSQSDSTDSAKKAKQEHPEAADNAGIGMQDERGAKGAHKG